MSYNPLDPVPGSSNQSLPTLSSEDPPKQGGNPVLGVVVLLISLVGIINGLGGFRMLFGKPLGTTVMRASECRSGMILTTQNGFSLTGICSQHCTTNAECGGSLRCFDGNCAPIGTRTLGQSCGSPWECADSAPICVSSQPLPPGIPAGTPTFYPPQNMCARECAAGGECPSGFACTVVGSRNVCVRAEVANPFAMP